jgi:hypothetical protein
VELKKKSSDAVQRDARLRERVVNIMAKLDQETEAAFPSPEKMSGTCHVLLNLL